MNSRKVASQDRWGRGRAPRSPDWGNATEASTCCFAGCACRSSAVFQRPSSTPCAHLVGTKRLISISLSSEQHFLGDRAASLSHEPTAGGGVAQWSVDRTLSI